MDVETATGTKFIVKLNVKCLILIKLGGKRFLIFEVEIYLQICKAMESSPLNL